jgi:type IV pilus assembly protein PilY1
MRTIKRMLLASGAAALGLAPGLARAQNDTHPRLPNVLLLVGNAGSMEYLPQPDPNITTNPTGVTLMTPESADAPPGAACTGTAGATSVLNRWATVVTVLTGSIPQSSYSCQAVNRGSGPFVAEYSYNDGTTTTKPYDYNYFLPFHRIYSNGCTVGAGLPDGGFAQNFWNSPATPFTYHDVNNKPCVWSGQASDGLLDAFSGLIRFGLMTYDTYPDPSTGIQNGTAADAPTAIRGMWSYYNGWQTATPSYPPTTTGTPNTGGPNTGPAAGFTVPSSNPVQNIWMEVGARNEAAPPWEGQLVPFGNPADDSGVQTSNNNIQWELLALRPYGASPLAGLLDDAEQFLFFDHDVNPTTTLDFGPYEDPYWQGGCRKTYIILISDGEPNMDLQTGELSNPPLSGPQPLPLCNAGTPQSCPYRTPAQIATHMAALNGPLNNVNQIVQTFVVGFGTSQPAAIAPSSSPNYNSAAYNPPPSGATTCATTATNGETPLQPLIDCTAANLAPTSAGGNTVKGRPSLAPCCTLHQIAYAGTPTAALLPTPAFFADNALELKLTLAGILSAIIGTTTARTYPVYAPAGNQNAQAMSVAPIAAYQFSSSFNVNALNASAQPQGMWTGNLVRERSSCVTGVATQALVDPTLGDDYAANINMDSPLTRRQFFTVVGAPVNGNSSVVNSDYTNRPFITSTGGDDGFGTYGPDSTAPTGPMLTSDTSFPGAMQNYPAAFGIAANQPVCANAFGVTSASQCTVDILNWEVGLLNPPQSGTQTLQTFSRDPANCPVGQTCSKLGAIYHSTPAVVGAPKEFLIDDTYTAYAVSAANVPIMLYTATMDGQLHAFEVALNNPAQQSNAIDGVMQNNELWSFMPPRVLQHILPNYNIPGVALLDGAPVVADVPGQPYTLTGLMTPVVPPANGYLYRSGTAATWHRVLLAGGGSAGGFYYALDVTDPTAPEFLWQLSTDAAGYPMFGLTTPTPTIAIVAIMIGGTLTQVPVAILPGGSGTSIPCIGTPPQSPVFNATVVNGVPISIASPNDMAGLNLNNKNGANMVNASHQALRCWDNSVNSTRASGNSLTIARLDTGQVLAHFIGSSVLSGADYSGAPGPGGASPAQTSNKVNNGFGNVFAAPFAAPLSGVPIAYPNQTGQVADRVYVGDSDGLLWRIDLSNPNPAGWFAQIAWDAYVLTGDTGLREPSQLAPVVARDPIGDVVVVYATGDQDTFTAQNSSVRLWSLTETPSPVTSTAYQMSQNWWMAFASGVTNCAANLNGPSSTAPSLCNRRITGPLALFNSVLYFSTFTPEATSVCTDGYASLWAVDFVRPDPTHATSGPVADFPNSGGANALYQDGASGTIIEGASVSQTVSCDTQNSTMASDPYFGSHNLVSNVTQATYQLNWNAGAGTGLSGGSVTNDANNQYNIHGTNSSASKIGTQQSMQIAGPGQATKIDSWGAVIGQ